MSDLISRAGAIETVRKAKSIGQAHRMLMQLPSAQRWIPVTERLPEEENTYLVTFANEKVGMSSWHKDTLYNRGFDAYLTGITEDGECEYFGVVAWMEKPKPWKGEEHGTPRGV